MERRLAGIGMAIWYSLTEVCIELRLGPRAVLKLLESGQLVGYRVPRNGRSRSSSWRILAPSQRLGRYLQESRERLEHVALLSSAEIAEVLGIKPVAIRQLKRRGRIQGQKVRNTTFYSVAEVRNLLRRRQKKTAPTRKLYSPILVKWLEGRLSRSPNIEAQILDELLRQTIDAPANSKTKYIVELWRCFDEISSLLKNLENSKRYACPDPNSE